MSPIAPKEDPVVLTQITLPFEVSVPMLEMPSNAGKSFRNVKGFVMLLYPKARIIRVWHEPLARRGKAQVTTIAIDGGLSWWAEGDTESAEQPSIHAAR